MKAGRIQPEFISHERRDMKKLRWASTVALTAAVMTSLTLPTAAGASATDNEVRNTGTSHIGGIDNWRGTGAIYANGYWDGLIAAGSFSGWRHTAGIYVGPGYCVRVRAWRYGTQQNPPPPAGLSNAVIVPSNTQARLDDAFPGWDIRALPNSNSGCANPLPAVDGLVTVSPIELGAGKED
jgi:hypothetical protein